MKKVTKFFMVALLAGMCSFGHAQDYLGNPKSTEKVIGTISETKAVWMSYPITQKRYDGSSTENPYATKQRWYETLLEKAKQEYPGKTIDIRNMEVGSFRSNSNTWGDYYNGPAIGKVVDLRDPETQTYGNLPQALNKALRNVREGSRLAIDQVTVINSMDRETLKDQLLDVLLDKGYRVVAKDYLEKLYEEQEAQQSGIYNDKTTVQENNFSAVGYYINVKVTETSLRVQVVNVSTGEYEGNATVNF
jgi:hypothetical protein